MAIDFPNNPNSGETFSVGNITWRWNGYAWNRVPDPGAKGEVGQKGQKGEVGLTGNVGQKGEKGDVEAKGNKGQKGEIGAQGPQGATGAQGPQGATGPQGQKGGGTGTADKIFEGNTEAEVVDTGTDGHFKVTTEGTERLRINSSGNVKLPDNGKLQFGGALNSGDGDLQIYHDTNHSYIVDQGTGELRLRANLFNLQTADGSGTMIGATENSNVNLYFNDNIKFSTTTDGVSIPQDLDVDGHTNLDNVSIAGVTTVSGNTLNLENADLVFLNNNHKIQGGASSFNVSIQGGATYAGGKIQLSGGANGGTGDIRFYADSTTTPVERVRINSSGTVSIFNDLDVDGHTNLDNVSIAGVTTASDNIRIIDDKKLLFGNGGDLQISHGDSLSGQNDSEGTSVLDGGTDGSLINESGTGPLVFKTNGGPGTGAYQFYDAGWRPILKLFSGSSARAALYYAGIEKLITDSAGISITGGIKDKDGDLGTAGQVLSSTGTELNWVAATSGPQGSQGTKGHKGEIGAQGPQGSQGTQGGTGPQGAQGPTGPQGSGGTKGQKGEVGNSVTGPTGPTGPSGGQGTDGDKGQKGEIGAQGTTGTVFTSGTRMLFQQSTAPSGWTKDTSLNNRALRLVSGTVGNGGSNTFSDAFNASRDTGGGSVANHTLTESQIPSHYHFAFRSGNHGQLRNASSLSSNNYPGSGSGAGNWYESYNISSSGSVSNVGRTSSVGSNSGHNHGFTNPNFNLNVLYTDVIIAQKN